MSELFILQNQDNLFLGKQNNWLDGRDPGALFKTIHKDEAINQMFEASSRDYKQRIKVIGCPANEKGFPTIDPAIMPTPLPKPGKDLFDNTCVEPSEIDSAIAPAEAPETETSPE
jgi:dissimilatory sulfite reductase (desulfoviridin) alpha/beta subunit